MFKVYESQIFIKRSINIEVNGKPRTISFTGGLKYPKKVFGIFSTNNEKEQAAIEEHPGFGTKFILKIEDIKSIKIEEEVILTEEPAKKERITVVNETVTTDNANEASPEMFGNKIVEKEAAATSKAMSKENVPKIYKEVKKEVIKTPETEEVVETNEVAITEVFEVEKVQQGKEYLMKKFQNEFTHRQLSNKNLVLAAAKEKNISFPNIP